MENPMKFLLILIVLSPLSAMASDRLATDVPLDELVHGLGCSVGYSEMYERAGLKHLKTEKSINDLCDIMVMNAVKAGQKNVGLIQGCGEAIAVSYADIYKKVDKTHLLRLFKEICNLKRFTKVLESI
jgi:hypothetical protein